MRHCLRGFSRIDLVALMALGTALVGAIAPVIASGTGQAGMVVSSATCGASVPAVPPTRRTGAGGSGRAWRIGWRTSGVTALPTPLVIVRRS